MFGGGVDDGRRYVIAVLLLADNAGAGVAGPKRAHEIVGGFVLVPSWVLIAAPHIISRWLELNGKTFPLLRRSFVVG